MFACLAISEAGRPDCIVAMVRTMTIGRAAENDIVLAAATVSRQHAMLFPDDVGMLLVDLESTNGTLLNGVLVRPDEPVRLADGDVIQLGAVVARYTAPSPDRGDLCAPCELAHVWPHGGHADGHGRSPAGIGASDRAGAGHHAA